MPFERHFSGPWDLYGRAMLEAGRGMRSDVERARRDRLRERKDQLRLAYEQLERQTELAEARYRAEREAGERRGREAEEIERLRGGMRLRETALREHGADVRAEAEMLSRERMGERQMEGRERIAARGLSALTPYQRREIQKNNMAIMHLYKGMMSGDYTKEQVEPAIAELQRRNRGMEGLPVMDITEPELSLKDQLETLTYTNEVGTWLKDPKTGSFRLVDKAEKAAGQEEISVEEQVKAETFRGDYWTWIRDPKTGKLQALKNPEEAKGEISAEDVMEQVEHMKSLYPKGQEWKIDESKLMNDALKYLQAGGPRMKKGKEAVTGGEERPRKVMEDPELIADEFERVRDTTGSWEAASDQILKNLDPRVYEQVVLIVNRRRISYKGTGSRIGKPPWGY